MEESEDVALEDRKCAKKRMEREDKIEDKIKHFSLKAALIQYQRQQHGQAANE